MLTASNRCAPQGGGKGMLMKLLKRGSALLLALVLALSLSVFAMAEEAAPSPEETSQAAAQAALTYGATDRNFGKSEGKRGIDECVRFVRENKRKLVKGMVGLHAQFTCSDDTIHCFDFLGFGYLGFLGFGYLGFLGFGYLDFLGFGYLDFLGFDFGRWGGWDCRRLRRSPKLW